MSGEYYDPYDINNYSTPIRTKGDNIKTNYKVFNPYETPKNDNEEKLPEFVDLTKNAYSQSSSGGTEGEEELPLLEGIMFFY